MRFLFVFCLIIFVLSGCAVGPEYKAPDSKVSDLFEAERHTPEEHTSKEAQVDGEWWKLFEDSVLSEIMEQAARHNKDVKIAKANVLESRALRRIAASRFYPFLDANLSASRQGDSKNRAFSSVSGFALRNYENYDAGFDANWELDVFGGIRRSVEAARTRTEVSKDDYRDILLSVLAETARNYFELRGAQKRLEIARKNIEFQMETVRLVSRQQSLGAAAEVDVARAGAQKEQTEAALPNIEADVQTSIYRLSVLTGSAPETLVEKLEPAVNLAHEPDIIPVGLRSTLLRRRPDVRRAERQLAASTADIGAATARLFPEFSLTGNVGLESGTLGDLLERESGAWNLSGLLNWPVFHGGEIRGQIQVEKAQAVADLYNYEQTVLLALEDAEASLTRYGKSLETRRRLQIAERTQSKATQMIKERYKAGEDDLLDVLVAERELVVLQDQLVRSEQQTLVDLVNVFKALGGGWEVFEPAKWEYAEIGEIKEAVFE